MSSGDERPGLFSGPFVWSGIGFAVAGYLAELLIDPEQSFEFFMLFGGLFLGVGYERNRQARRRSNRDGNS